MPNNNATKLKYVGSKTGLEFTGTLLQQEEITDTHKTIVNSYIVYELSKSLNSFDLALKNCLFGAVKLTKNVDIDKHKYSGYGIGFDARGTFSFSIGGQAQNIIIFGADMSWRCL